MRMSHAAIVSFGMFLATSRGEAAGLLPQEVKAIREYFQAFEMGCENRDPKTPLADCYEAEALKLHSDLAQRKDGRLTLRLVEGEKRYDDTLSEQNTDGWSYQLLGYVRPLDAFLLLQGFYEGSQTWLLNRNTGKELALLGFPGGFAESSTLNFNATGDRMLDYNYDQSDFSPSGLRVYSYDREEGFALQHDGFTPCMNPARLKPDPETMVLENISANFNGIGISIQPTLHYTIDCQLPRS
jgi:hypothetical protein